MFQRLPNGGRFMRTAGPTGQPSESHRPSARPWPRLRCGSGDASFQTAAPLRKSAGRKPMKHGKGRRLGPLEPNTPRQKRKKGKKRLATGGPVPLGRVGMERRVHGGGLPGLGARAAVQWGHIRRLWRMNPRTEWQHFCRSGGPQSTRPASGHQKCGRKAMKKRRSGSVGFLGG